MHSWFQHSYVYDLLKQLTQHDVKLVITTDHGAVRVINPGKGDRRPEYFGQPQIQAGKKPEF